MENVRSVERALKILKAIGPDGKGLTVSKISEKTNLHTTTVIRLIATLKSEDFVSRDLETLTYKLGNSFVEIAGNMPQRDLHEVAQVHMQELVEKSKETVALFVISGTKRVCVDRIEGLHPIRWHIEIGDSAPLGVSSSGKLLLATTSELQQNKILKHNIYFKDGSVVDRNKLKTDLEVIRMQGYASSFCENSLDGGGISAPVMNAKGKVIACLTILGPISRINLNTVETYKDVLIYTADKISSELKNKNE